MKIIDKLTKQPISLLEAGKKYHIPYEKMEKLWKAVGEQQDSEARLAPFVKSIDLVIDFTTL